MQVSILTLHMITADASKGMDDDVTEIQMLTILQSDNDGHDTINELHCDAETNFDSMTCQRFTRNCQRNTHISQKRSKLMHLMKIYK